MASPIDTQTTFFIAEQYSLSAKRLLLFDYDGTLVPFEKNPANAVPCMRLIGLLNTASADIRNTTAIISGRTRQFLNRHLSLTGLTLIAEHGAFIRLPGKEWFSPREIHSRWKDDVARYLQSYLCPGSMIEMKETSVVWHYRECEEKAGLESALRIQSDIAKMFEEPDCPNILSGNKVVEFTPRSVSKGNAVRHILASHAYDFILALGDDINDESMFQALPYSALTVKIGKSESFARFILTDHKVVMPFLEKIVFQGAQ